MITIRKIQEKDREIYLKMAEKFYSTDAVAKKVAGSHFELAFDEVLKSDTYASAYIFEYDAKVAGYVLMAKTYSQEAGGLVLWVEEIFVEESYRGKGIAKAFFRFLLDTKGDEIKRLRLEVEAENTDAVRLYKSFGFEFLEYDQMIVDF
jgi:GNAT superfamily N-acetyltransferase